MAAYPIATTTKKTKNYYCNHCGVDALLNATLNAIARLYCVHCGTLHTTTEVRLSTAGPV